MESGCISAGIIIDIYARWVIRPFRTPLSLALTVAPEVSGGYHVEVESRIDHLRKVRLLLHSFSFPL